MSAPSSWADWDPAVARPDGCNKTTPQARLMRCNVKLRRPGDPRQAQARLPTTREQADADVRGSVRCDDSHKGVIRIWELTEGRAA